LLFLGGNGTIMPSPEPLRPITPKLSSEGILDIKKPYQVG